MSDKIYAIISKVMNVPISEINDSSGPENIESWDSFNSYVLLDEVETEFNIKFGLDEVLEVKKVGDIKKLLEKYGKI